MRLHWSRRTPAFLFGLIAFLSAGALARVESAPGGQGIRTGPGWVEVRSPGGPRRYRFDEGDPRSAALIARLRRPGRALGAATRRIPAAVEDFLVFSSRLQDRESYRILAGPPALDLDGDDRGELFIQTLAGFDLDATQIWEYDDASARFTRAHVYSTEELPGLGGSFGDVDGDGVREILTLDWIQEPMQNLVHVLKQAEPNSYDVIEERLFVTHHTCCTPASALVADLDGDHRAEVVFSDYWEGNLTINERGDAGEYREVFWQVWPTDLVQAVLVTNDLDDDGRPELLLGGFGESRRRGRFSGLLLLEADGDDHYRVVWNDGPHARNVDALANAGDTDGDGRKEFVAASTNGDLFNPGEQCTLYEYDGAGGFRVTWEAPDPLYTFFDEIGVDTYDFDGDGRREILCYHRGGPDFAVDVYRATGNDTYELFTSLPLGSAVPGDPSGALAFGDFDRDQRPDLIVNRTDGDRLVTDVFETADVYPAPPPAANFGGSPVSGSAPLTVRFSDLSDGAVTTRSWAFGDGETSAEATPTHVYERPGAYTVRLDVTGPGGAATKTREAYVTVGSCPAEALLGREPGARSEGALGSIRGFRDGVLARSRSGRALITSYYRNGAEVERLLRARPGLALRTARLLAASAPLFGAAASGTALTLDRSTWDRAMDLARELEAAGSSELRRDIAKARALVAAAATTASDGAVTVELR